MTDRRVWTFVPPPIASPERLAADLEIAKANFRRVRLTEPAEEYAAAFVLYETAFLQILEETDDLLALDRRVLSLLDRPRTGEALRYLTSPPISEDDLETVIDASIAPQSLRQNPSSLDAYAETLRTGLDRRRFPWVALGRSPDPIERRAAILASSALLASRRVETDRRSRSKRGQEGAVKDALLSVGFIEVPARSIGTLDDAPMPGHFSMESVLGRRKADLVVRLFDRRVLAIECKVSNSSLNSIKRLNNDAAVKAQAWLKDFGTAQIIPSAVLSGVFKLQSLSAAQFDGLVLFWEHDLAALTAFLRATSPVVG